MGPSRRSFIAGAGAAVFTVLPSNRALGSRGQNIKAPIVLVHGAWHGGWCWRDVAPLLEAAGHSVHTPTMAGLGDRSNMNLRDINLTTHVSDIVALIEQENLRDIILVGHSYAGYVVTLVADAMKDRIAHLIYLDAVLPVDGNPFVAQDQQADLSKKFEASFALPPSSFDMLGIPEDHPSAAWVRRNLKPHPLGTLFEPVVYKNGGAKGIPKTFIRCKDNPIRANGDYVVALADKDPELSYLLLDTGHDAMITAPAPLAQMILKTASAR